MANRTESNRRWRAANREKIIAHTRVNTAKRNGSLAVQPCEVCGDAHGQAHHDDYDKPLAVRWLCSTCHRVEHYVPPPKKEPKPRKPTAQPWHSIFHPAPKRDVFGEEARRLRANGATYDQIAAAVGVSKGTVYKWLNPKPDYG